MRILFLNSFIYNIIESYGEGCLKIVKIFWKDIPKFIENMDLVDFDLFVDKCYRKKEYTNKSIPFGDIIGFFSGAIK